MKFASVRFEPQHILDFDIENRPLAYWYDDKTTGEMTAIAWAWAHGDEPVVHTLKPPPRHEKSMLRMLTEFRKAYDAADMVTGHYIRVHDLPIVNAHMIEFGLEPLGPKLTSDTKLDLVRTGQFSASQMALSKHLGIKAQKPRMSQGRWRDANRLTPQGIEAAVERVTGDVRQHMELRLELIARKMLGEPKVWVP